MPETLYVAWQNGTTRRWHTIARLQKKNDEYDFVFTKGISGVADLARQLFDMDSGNLYRFRELIPLFKSRMMSTNRGDYKKVADWVGILPDDAEFDRLCKLGLIPGSDSMLFYAAPELSGERYKLSFFVHASRYMHADAKSWCLGASPGTKLCPLLDVQNVADPNAVALKCPTDNVLVGYVPAFYARDLKIIFSDEQCAKRAEILISRNNKDAPDQLRLMCELVTPVPDGFKPLDTPEHEPNLRLGGHNGVYDRRNTEATLVPHALLTVR